MTRWTILFFLTTFCYLQSVAKDTTIVTFDSITGIRKEVHITKIGRGGGYHGSAPRKMKQTIKKYDKDGKLIYLSNKTRRLRGCIASIKTWNIMVYKPDGGYTTLTLKKYTVTVQQFNKAGQLLTKTETSLGDFNRQSWMDEDEGEHGYDMYNNF